MHHFLSDFRYWVFVLRKICALIFSLRSQNGDEREQNKQTKGNQEKEIINSHSTTTLNGWIYY